MHGDQCTGVDKVIEDTDGKGKGEGQKVQAVPIRHLLCIFGEPFEACGCGWHPCGLFYLL